MDIEHFFDCINHDLLKQAWCSVLGTTELPEDHYAVFKAVTRYASVDREKAYKELSIGQRKRKTWRKPMCTPEVFRQKIRGNKLIEVNKTRMGIPQGSPISALLSNIYMMKVDESMQQLAHSLGGVYFRYSDDVLLIGPTTVADQLESQLKTEVDILKLKINDDKTARSRFAFDSEGKQLADKPLQYLGFTFNGEKVLIRSQTLSKYIRRMKAGVRSAKRAAIRASKRGGLRKLRRQELYSRYSHLGPRTSNRQLTTGSKLKLKTNLWSYTKRAAEIIDDKSILRQLRKHWPRLNAEIQIADGD